MSLQSLALMRMFEAISVYIIFFNLVALIFTVDANMVGRLFRLLSFIWKGDLAVSFWHFGHF
jgi:hypothetical protein